MKRGDTLKLNKTEISPNDSKCFWKFDVNSNFKDGCSNLLDLTYSETYRWDIDEGNILFSISSGFKKSLYKGDTVVNVANYGANFNLLELTNSKLILEYLWD